MRWILCLIVTIWLFGCGSEKSESSEEKLGAPRAFTNTLGMKFVPVPEAKVQFCIWETRMKDYAVYATANIGVNEDWKGASSWESRRKINHPVTRVSWEDAVAFCKWLTEKELAEGIIEMGQKYRLPTDAEWSAAVGLGQEKGKTPAEKSKNTEGGYPWGKEWPPYAKAGNYDLGSKIDRFKNTAPVGSFAANKFGLHDMGGNAWEWCEDSYFGPGGLNRVLRGACWNTGEQFELLSSYRVGLSHDLRYGAFIGFRCVLASE